MRLGMWVSLASATLLAGAGFATATDTVKLGGPTAIQGSADTELVHYRGGYRGGYGGGWGRGYYGGGWGRGYYGGGWGRGYYGGGWGRGYYAGGWGRGYYGGYYGNRGFYGGYYGTPYYYGSYYVPSVYYYAPSCYPISGDLAPTLTVQGNAYYPPANNSANTQLPGDGTFPYDGGPRQLVPTPKADVVPMKNPGLIPLDGKLVSLPTEISGGVAPITTPEMQRLNYVTSTTPPAPRVSYPAYGEDPIPAVPRKIPGR